MNNFKEILLQTKKISIWGIGYLGYTTILKLQENGFYSSIYDFNESRLDDLLKKKYPDKEQLNSWSKNGKVPFLDLDTVEITKNKTTLFDNKIHIISFPNTDEFNYLELAKLFIENKDKLQDSLIIFQSAGMPTLIKTEFCEILETNGLNVEIATVFRSDWIIEDFLNTNLTKIVSGNNDLAINKTNIFLDLLNLKSIRLSSIEEAEIYENTKNSLNYTIVAFFNQMSLAYPHLNINALSTKLLKNIDFTSLSLGVSGVDYKSEQSIENILRSSSGDFLTILKEANNTNLSFLFYYVNLLKNKNLSSVTILGLSSYGTMKDLRFSPSVMLAEYLHKENIKVYIHDNNFTYNEVLDVLPHCKFIDIDKQAISSDVVIVMNLSKEYKFFTQDKIDSIGLSKAKYILDNTGFFKHFKYGDATLYHQLCDGELIKVIN